VSFALKGEVRIIPTTCIRLGDGICLHGSGQNQMMNSMLDGQTACIAVTSVDGRILARLGLHHSVNYQSVVVFGAAVEKLKIRYLSLMSLLIVLPKGEYRM